VRAGVHTTAQGSADGELRWTPEWLQCNAPAPLMTSYYSGVPSAECPPMDGALLSCRVPQISCTAPLWRWPHCLRGYPTVRSAHCSGLDCLCRCVLSLRANPLRRFSSGQGAVQAHRDSFRLNGGSFRRSMRGSMHRPSSQSNTHHCTITARLCGSFLSRVGLCWFVAPKSILLRRCR
jgi:hypothetical protein